MIKKNLKKLKEDKKAKQIRNKILGTNYSQQIYNNKIEEFYQFYYIHPVDYSDIQTFDEFLIMDRNKIMNGQNKIGIFNFTRNDVQLLKEYITIFFQLSVKLIETPFNIKYSKKQYKMINKQDKSYYNIQTHDQRMNVFDIMNVMEDFIPSDCFTVACIIDEPIYDPEQIQNEILGRAIGDRICVIQQDDCKQRFLMTCVHELMHTFGIDHCTIWKCIMNPEIDGQMNLCPPDIRKLQNATNLKIIKWYQDLLNFYLKQNWKEGIQWLNELLKII